MVDDEIFGDFEPPAPQEPPQKKRELNISLRGLKSGANLKINPLATMTEQTEGTFVANTQQVFDTRLTRQIQREKTQKEERERENRREGRRGRERPKKKEKKFSIWAYMFDMIHQELGQLCGFSSAPSKDKGRTA